LFSNQTVEIKLDDLFFVLFVIAIIVNTNIPS